MEQWTYDAERYGPPNQPHITVDELLSHPDIIPVLKKSRWSRQEKSKIAAVLKNRPSVDMSKMSDPQTFQLFWDKVVKLSDTDKQFEEELDPAYIIVDFAGQGVPANYRDWLDQANHFIGGPAPVPNVHHVAPGAAQQITFVDRTGNDLGFLQIASRIHADHVAGVLRSHGLKSWVMFSKIPATYR